MSHTISPEGHEFFRLIATYLTRDQQALVRKAYELAQEEHGDAVRRSGEPYFTHPLTIAYYLAEFSLDAETLAAALLHDVAEDTIVSVEQIEEQFGSEVAQLVDGLTKFETVADDPRTHNLSREEMRNATLHKLLRFMTSDIRVGVIKIFDRLHNMRTIKFTPPESQRRKANETLAVYSRLAHRLGMWTVKNELETLALEVLDPDAYDDIQHQIQQIHYRQQMEYSEISRELAGFLTSHDVQIVDMFPSHENPYTTFRNSVKRGQRGQYYADDTLRLIVVLKDVASCYLALGHTHKLWRPVRHTFDDYIAAPMDNLYQSLHTTVIHHKSRLKVRFRTSTMNTLAEIGVLAKWLAVGMPLKSPNINMHEIDQHVAEIIAGIRDSINLEPQDLGLGVESVVKDVLSNQIVIFTPKKDAKQLPQGATCLDFAYTIHTEVGAQCRGALVNGRPYPLNRELQDGDSVHILKRGNAPQRVWLDVDLGYLTTNRAQTQVRRWFRRIPSTVAVREGRQLLNYELDMLGLADCAHDEIADLFGFDHAESLYYGLGKAELLPTVVATRTLVDRWLQGPRRNIGAEVRSEEGEKFIITNTGGRQVRLCRTCQPRPGDSIIGFMRSDRLVTAHLESCLTVPSDPFANRTLKLRWGEEGMQEVRLVTVQIDVFDRPGLLSEISELIGVEDINIPEVHSVSQHGEAKITLMMEVISPRQLVRVLHRIHALVNVFAVRCLNMS